MQDVRFATSLQKESSPEYFIHDPHYLCLYKSCEIKSDIITT